MKLFVGSFFKAISFALAVLPRRVRDAIGVFLGFLWFDVFRIRRKVAIENVALAFPELPSKERVRVARQSLHHMGRTIMDFTLFPFFEPSDVPDYFVIEGREYVDEALKLGKGILFLSLHLGNGDFGTAALSQTGLKVHLISKEFKLRWLNDLWFGMRRKHGTHFISAEKSSFEILRALRKNEIVVFVLDQFMGPPIGVRTKFFGKETGTAAGLALMAYRTGAPVIPSYTYRRGDGRHAIVFEKPVPFQDNSLTEKNIAVMTQVYTDKIESIVRQHPEQWMWIHRRWKEFRE
jgi:KDO2-lipid IV(A) lauroyltransferase